MEEHKILIKTSTKSFPIPIGDQSAIFLKRYSSELEFLAPWAQHDNYLENKRVIVNRIKGIEKIQFNKKIVLTKTKGKF